MSGSLTHSPAAILRQLMVDLSLGSLYSAGGSWSICYGSEPAQPDQMITVYDTDPVDQGRDMYNGRRNERHGVQIRIRAKDEASGFTKARAIAVSLDEDVSYTGVTISSSGYIVYTITRISGPISLGKAADSRRNLFTINVTMSIRQST